MPHNPESSSPITSLPTDSFGARLTTLPPERILTTEDLEWLCGVNDNGISRAVKRGDLPVPATIFGRHVWTVRAIYAHIDRLLEDARTEAERERQQRDTKVRALYGRD